MTPLGEERAVYPIERWAADEEVWDHETGAPSITHFGNALQVWSVLQNRSTSVADAAEAFNVAPGRIIEAVEESGWMYLAGPQDDYRRLMIEHDGE